jgi:hypothetical protein
VTKKEWDEFLGDVRNVILTKNLVSDMKDEIKTAQKYRIYDEIKWREFKTERPN